MSGLSGRRHKRVTIVFEISFRLVNLLPFSGFSRNGLPFWEVHEFMLRTQNHSRRAIHLLLFLIFSAFLTRIFIAVVYENNFDTGWYIRWARGLQDGFFNIYRPDRMAEVDLDYPPLLLFPLYLVGAFLKTPILSDYAPYRMLIIKFFPVVYDCLLIGLLYLFAAKKLQSPQKGLIIAGLWAINPSAIYNCACWGQTDAVLMLLLLLTFWLFEEDMPTIACVIFAVATLTKNQALYFAPVIFFYLLGRGDVKALLKGLGAGLGTVLAGWLPFMIGAGGNVLLPYDLYMKGVSRYNQVNLNAANVYGLFPSLNWANDDLSLFGGQPDAEGVLRGGFTYANLSTILLVFSVLLVGYCLLLKSKGKKNAIFHGSLLFLQCIFMLTARQHERYQFCVIGLALALYVLTELNSRYLLLLGGVTLTTFFNQFFLLSKVHSGDGPWVGSFETLLAVVSAVNVLLFVYTLYLCYDYFFGRKGRPRAAAAVQAAPEQASA